MASSKSIIRDLVVRFEQVGIGNAQSEVLWLLEKLTGKNQSQLLISDVQLTDDQHKTLEQWVHDRIVLKKPLQYILGVVPFCGMDLVVRAPILIPRPETEEWCLWLIEQFSKVNQVNFAILDLCSGSGCIALALAQAFPKSQVIGVDVDEEAIALARENQAGLEVKNVEFVQADAGEFLQKTDLKFDLVVSNPPYLAARELGVMYEKFGDWEAKRALVAENEGLKFYQEFSQLVPCVLTPSSGAFPCLVFEIGHLQAEKVAEIMKNQGFAEICVKQDLYGKDRIVFAYLCKL